MSTKRNTILLSTLTAFSLAGTLAANAQERLPLPSPRSESRIFQMELPTPSYLGVQTENVNQENFGKYSLNEARGVAVVKVVENSPAARAGLRDKDVILRFDGEPVRSVSKLLRLIEEVAPDQKAALTVYRSGGEQEIVVTMGKRPAPQNGGFERFGRNLPFPPTGEFPAIPPTDFQGFGTPDSYENFLSQRGDTGRKLGVSVQPLTKQLAEFFGATGGKGLLVEDVAAASAAARAGLRAGDVILEIDGAAVATQADLIRALNKNQEGDVSIVILRDKQRQTVRATPEGKKQTASADNGTKFKI